MQRRTELLLGKDNLEKIQEARVLIFGIGGVGSWCAEGLVRSGVRNITIVDSDHVCVTNCNRQLMATSRTIGQVKVDALRDRLLEINPEANITAYQKIYQAETAEEFHMEEYDYIIDAIDSLKDKADLILRATALPKEITFVSSMGAALRRDPFMVRKAEFWKVDGDPLARALRKKFKKNKKTVTIKKQKTTKTTVKKLKAKKKYYVRVCTYKTVKINGKSIRIYSGWSKTKTVTTKK